MSVHSYCYKRILKKINHTFSRYYSQRKLTNAEVHKKRNAIFKAEKARQLALITRTEKIRVQYKGVPEDCLLYMNKGLSTPYHCAMHMSEMLTTRSALAAVDGKVWDMHRPLEKDCTLEFMHFLDENPMTLNYAFWRSCSFILGYILEKAFRDNIYVQLCSFPRPDIKSGSFVYDCDLNDLGKEWKPTETELRTLSRMGYKLQAQDLKFERLTVSYDVAKEMFEDNKYKTDQIPIIAENSENKRSVVLYRLGDHIDISNGPMIAGSSFLSTFKIASLHNYEHEKYGKMQRLQGVAIPKYLMLHYWTFEKLCERATKLNIKSLPAVNIKKYYSKKNKRIET